MKCIANWILDQMEFDVVTEIERNWYWFEIKVKIYNWLAEYVGRAICPF